MESLSLADDQDMPESKPLKFESDSEPEVMVPPRKAARKRKVESSCDEDDMGLDIISKGPKQPI